jgi:hypothetical protein
MRRSIIGSSLVVNWKCCLRSTAEPGGWGEEGELSMARSACAGGAVRCSAVLVLQTHETLRVLRGDAVVIQIVRLERAGAHPITDAPAKQSKAKPSSE